MADETELFIDKELSAVLAGVKQHILREIDQCDRQTLLSVRPQDYSLSLIAQYDHDVPTLLRDHIVVTHEERTTPSQDLGRSVVSRSGVAIYHVPFDGEAKLFGICPSRFDLVAPRAAICIGPTGVHELQLIFKIDGTEGRSLDQVFERRLDGIEQFLSTMRSDLEKWRKETQSELCRRIEERRARFVREQQELESTKYPIRQRGNAVADIIVPVVRKKVPLCLPPAELQPCPAQTALGDEAYEDILNSLKRMAEVLERSPQAFARMCEEDLRMIFLVNLNGLYEGQAAGEVFNFTGKTDLLIRAGGRNVFIAECKFWQGKKAFCRTIDQLLGYLTWQDTKAAILLFNRNKNLSAVLQDVDATAKMHEKCKQALARKSETDFRYRFHHRDDPARDISVAVLVFEVPRHQP